ncbi:hypothetical protein Angca_001123, partial [Angiostrongylus cantonensis]
DIDATRFFCILDSSKPFEKGNMVTCRFTRVIFGLNCSSFRLAGVSKCHLNNC